MKKAITILLIICSILFFNNNAFATNTYSTDLESSSSQYFYKADSASLSITGDITIETWIKLEQLPSAAGAYMSLLNKARADGNLSYVFYFINDDRIYFSYWPNGTSDGNNTAAHINNFVVAGDVGNWVHIAVTVDVSAKTITFYKNGTAQSTVYDVQNSTTIFDGNANAVVGATYWGGTYEQFFDGKIDDMRVWNVVRSEPEISSNYSKELAGSESNLVAYYKFNNDALDETSNNNDLTAVNTPTYSTDVAFVETAANIKEEDNNDIIWID